MYYQGFFLDFNIIFFSEINNKSVIMKSNKKNTFLIFVVFSLISCDSMIVTPILNVCDCEKYESAQIYNPNEKIHKIILYDGNTLSNWYSNLPKECQGTYSNFELVGCIKTTQDYELNACFYDNGGKRTRKTQKVVINLIEAKTGKIIDSNEFLGEVDGCPSVIYDKTDIDILGHDVEYDQVKDWLLGYLIKN